MEATQLIDDSILEESEEEDGEMRKEKRGEPLAKLRVLKNEHISETELPLYQGENVLGRNPNSCSLPLVARSVSKQHTVISISMFHGNRCHGNVAAMETEALVWDLGSMNGTRKGRTKLTPHVRYALTEGECVVIADIPCQYVSVDQRGGQRHMQNPINAHSGRGRRTGPDRKAQFRGSPIGHGLGRKTGTPKTERPTEGRGVNGEMGAPSLTELGGKGQTRAIPLLLEQTPTQPERTLVPESESDSDGDREGRRDKRGKYFVSDSDSHMSSPTCSTFLSPTNKVIPESEDDRPITHSSAKNRPKKVVSFSEEESDMDGPRKHPRRRRAQVIVDDSEEEGKEGTEALGEKETGKRTRGKEDVSVVNQVPQTPTGKGRGKRRAPVESSPFAKTPRSSSASPLSSLSSPGTLGRARASTQSYKVLFTGVVDEEGGKVVSRLGGSLAKGVADMTHLVTDRIRRTVKFLCAVARGVPVVTTDWLDKCGKVSSFLPTDRYLVKDREQENKFSFCLEESLRTASIQPLLQGYEVHVTRSVLPQPAQMKDIIVCSGARFLSKMPSTQKAQARTLVISCGEDWSLCAPAFSASLPVLSAEFLLTGILQQRVDLVTHVLPAPKLRAQPGAKGQASGRKRT
ncbi:mediator of DNA damage checkpoint protein 1 isoform X1 [Salvelinus sp. IW2-2015]|uniref:mediator of DNA damage checkpoint protein 1 isoform X1 n=1 Tax=Salvelinus sp. IW2-2015 TaxID=2691554 RepID=UPI000CEADF7A|nr:mediator of DNA damage checkpoint protein 1-like isoform X1 [Salvelinus alpinus]